MTRYEQNQSTLKEAINQLLDTYKLRSKMRLSELRQKWPSLVGPMIAKHTTELFIKDKTLFIRFDSAPLKQEVHMMRSKLKNHLNNELGADVIHEVVAL